MQTKVPMEEPSFLPSTLLCYANQISLFLFLMMMMTAPGTLTVPSQLLALMGSGMTPRHYSLIDRQ